MSAATPSSALVPRDVAGVVTAIDESPRVHALLDEGDRLAADRTQDAPRQTGALLTWLDIHDGANVVELASGGGYLTEVLARSVGPGGRLFAENPPSLLTKRGLSEAWEQRLARPLATRVVRLDEELGRSLPMHAVDLVLVGDDLGDLASQGFAPADEAVPAWNSLDAGGRFVVVEPAGPNGEPRPETRAAAEQCGFRLVSEGRFLRDGRVATMFVKP